MKIKKVCQQSKQSGRTLFFTECIYCEKLFSFGTNHIGRKPRYCSCRCSFLDNEKNLLGPDKGKRFQLGNMPWNRGLTTITNDIIKKMAESKRGHPRPDMMGLFKHEWENENYIERVLAGQIFGSGAYSRLTPLQRKIIRLEVLKFKINRSQKNDKIGLSQLQSHGR
jgi:hypothetical protein